MTVSRRVAVMLTWLVLIPGFCSCAEGPSVERSATLAQKEGLVAWLRDHEMAVERDGGGDVVEVKRRVGENVFDVAPPPRLSRDVIVALAALPKLERLNLSATIIEDEDFEGVSGFRALQGLCLNGTSVSGKALRAFSESSNLAKLQLDYTGDVGSGLDAISAGSLRTLSLCGPHIGDDTIKTVARFSNLERLHVDSPGMTVRGLSSLAQLRRLRFLGVTAYRPNADYSALNALGRQLPDDCHAVFGIRELP